MAITSEMHKKKVQLAVLTKRNNQLEELLEMIISQGEDNPEMMESILCKAILEKAMSLKLIKTNKINTNYIF